MNPEQAAKELKVIRQLMERPIRFSTLSGLSAILAGLAALGGCKTDWYVSSHYEPRTAFWINLGVWAGVFVVALLAVLAMTAVRERRQGMPFWSPIKRRILMTVLPCFVAGVGLTMVIAFQWYEGGWSNHWALIPPIWMAFYGVALWQLGAFCPIEVRLLGAAFVLASLAAAIWWQLEPYWALGVTFGGFHVVYGVAVWARHGG